MKGFTPLTLSMLLFCTPAFSGNMNMCRDAKGNVTFTQIACPDNTTGKRRIYVPPAQAPMRGLSSGEVSEINRIRQRDYQRNQEIEHDYTQEERNRKDESTITNKEKEKQRIVRDIEYDMRRGAISKRKGHKLISNIQIGSGEKEKQQHIRDIELDMRRNAISKGDGIKIISDIQAGRKSSQEDLSTKYTPASTTVRKSPFERKRAYDYKSGKHYKVDIFNGKPRRVISTDGSRPITVGVSGNKNKARLPDGRILKLK